MEELAADAGGGEVVYGEFGGDEAWAAVEVCEL